jgi:TonB family protein
MAFRALLFSKSPETSTAMTAACRGAGLRAEACSDIFDAIEKGTKQPFSCVIADWADQPEAGFLLKRAREAAADRSVLALAIVDHEPTAAEMRDHRLDYLIYRAMAADEARDVFTKAVQKMAPSSADSDPEPAEAEPATEAFASAPAEEAPTQTVYQGPEAEETAEPAAHEGYNEPEDELAAAAPARRLPFSMRTFAAVALALGALYFLWNARDTVVYLARTPENKGKVFKDAVAAYFNLTPTAAAPVAAVSTDAQQDAYFSRTPVNAGAQTPELAVVSTESDLSERRVQSRKPADLPLPEPTFAPPAPAPQRQARAAIPDSLRGSAPITQPVVVTVNPAQMMPVSAPMTPPVSTQSFSEPVALSEEAARALLIRSVDPSYPPEATSQKLHGPVVLQATIGRDGSVEDLKIVRGAFVLCKAAITAVKQWKFQPYTLNGHPAQTQTTLTITFTAPTG